MARDKKSQGKKRIIITQGEDPRGKAFLDKCLTSEATYKLQANTVLLNLGIITSKLSVINAFRLFNKQILARVTMFRKDKKKSGLSLIAPSELGS